MYEEPLNKFSNSDNYIMDVEEIAEQSEEIPFNKTKKGAS